jgi:hemolysin III
MDGAVPPSRNQGATSSVPATNPAWNSAERTADIYVLSCGLFLGLAASIALVAASFARHQMRLFLGSDIYVAGLLAMLACSLLYRAAVAVQRRRFFRRFDHAAIFAMIAGTATPFALAHAGNPGIILTVALWAGAAIGIAVKLRWPIGGVRPSVVVYLALGWGSAIAVGPSVSPAIMTLIAAGGALYSAGVVFLLWRRLPYNIAIWHAFVLAGAACHYWAILDSVLLA